MVTPANSEVPDPNAWTPQFVRWFLEWIGLKVRYVGDKLEVTGRLEIRFAPQAQATGYVTLLARYAGDASALGFVIGNEVLVVAVETLQELLGKLPRVGHNGSATVRVPVDWLRQHGMHFTKLTGAADAADLPELAPDVMPSQIPCPESPDEERWAVVPVAWLKKNGLEFRPWPPPDPPAGEEATGQ